MIKRLKYDRIFRIAQVQQFSFYLFSFLFLSSNYCLLSYFKFKILPDVQFGLSIASFFLFLYITYYLFNKKLFSNFFGLVISDEIKNRSVYPLNLFCLLKKDENDIMTKTSTSYSTLYRNPQNYLTSKIIKIYILKTNPIYVIN